VPVVGASGAIAAVLGAYFVLFPGKLVLAVAFVNVIPVPAVIFLGLWFVGQFLIAAPGVAWESHAAGFVVGAAVSLAFRGSLLARVRRGDVAAVHSLRRGAAEALELVAHGDAKSSQVVGRRVEEIDLPKGTTIGAIVRRRAGATEHDEQSDQVIIAHHDTVIEADDHVIVFVVNKRMVPRVEKLFQVEARFF